MTAYAYRILNVFSRAGRLTGNPLCVFEDGDGISDDDMQALARQFNLSETTFVLPSSRATRVRAFTPSYEMPYSRDIRHWVPRMWCATSGAAATS
jgi:PhzF family phenazine biosynthesis protein